MKMLEVGIRTFQKLFDSHPSAKTKFLHFKDMEITDLRGSDMFRNHVSRVMGTIKRVRRIVTYSGLVKPSAMSTTINRNI